MPNVLVNRRIILSSAPFVFDADALTFFTTAGVTNATAKLRLNSYVTGVKALGLWSNLACWPMRSEQNAGTGTTVFKLGGLAGNDGAMTNSPTWDSNGIVFQRAVANGTYIDIGSSPTGADSITIMAGVKRTETLAFNGLGCGLSAGLGSYWALGAWVDDFWKMQDPANTDSTVAAVSGSWANVTMTADIAAGNKITVDGSTPVTDDTNLVNPGTTAMHIGEFRNGAGLLGFTGNMAYFIHLNTALSSANIEIHRALATSTLGQGLAFP